jgi:hypothetical protein
VTLRGLNAVIPGVAAPVTAGNADTSMEAVPDTGRPG